VARISSKLLKPGIDASKIADGSVSDAEFQYLNGVTSGIQGQLDLKAPAVAGDLQEVSFSLANNQASFANVTGVAFTNANTRSAEINYSIVIDATADLYESGKIFAIQRGSDWVISKMTNGDDSQVAFSMTTLGQLQYTTPSYAGFVSGTIKCRAITTSV
jgi:hypothetical protein